MKAFKDFLTIKENEQPAAQKEGATVHILDPGFNPTQSSNLVIIIEAFLKKDVEVMKDTTKPIIIKKKPLYLVGGPVRDFLLNRSIKDYDLATPATPIQIATILNNAGFSYGGGRSQEDTQFMEKLPFNPKYRENSNKVWFIKGRDASKNVFVIGANVNGQEFDIATFRKDAKMGQVADDAQARDKRTPNMEFVDNIHDDASRRDFTINSMYIELNKANGPNNKLHDPTGQGWHDIHQGVVRTVGAAKDRFTEDPLRVLRAIRFHCRFSKGETMDADIEKNLPDFVNLDKKIALERIRQEFLSGLLDPGTNLRPYINIYVKKGFMGKVLPGINIHPDIPTQFTEKRDKPLALAWLMQGNPLASVEKVLSGVREMDDGETKPTGWASEEKRAVLFLLKLIEFHPKDVSALSNQRKGTGLSEQQIKDWVDMFNYTDGANRVRNKNGPQWSATIKTFADHKPSVKWDQIAHEYPDIPQHHIGQVIAGRESEEFLKKLPKTED